MLNVKAPLIRGCEKMNNQNFIRYRNMLYCHGSLGKLLTDKVKRIYIQSEFLVIVSSFLLFVKHNTQPQYHSVYKIKIGNHLNCIEDGSIIQSGIFKLLDVLGIIRAFIYGQVFCEIAELPIGFGQVKIGAVVL